MGEGYVKAAILCVISYLLLFNTPRKTYKILTTFVNSGVEKRWLGDGNSRIPCVYFC